MDLVEHYSRKKNWPDGAQLVVSYRENDGTYDTVCNNFRDAVAHMLEDDHRLVGRFSVALSIEIPVEAVLQAAMRENIEKEKQDGL